MKITNKRARQKINELINDGGKVYQTPLYYDYEVPRGNILYFNCNKFEIVFTFRFDHANFRVFINSNLAFKNEKIKILSYKQILKINENYKILDQGEQGQKGE